MKKRFVIVHRWSGGPTDDWRPWLVERLVEAGHEVILPSMPDSDVPVIEKWVEHLQSIVGVPNEGTYFIGHSIGCQAILRYFETVDKKVGGAYFVAPWFNLANLEDEETRAIAKPWIETAIDFEKVKNVCPNIVVLLSSNEPYGFIEENKKILEEKLDAKVRVLEKHGHFTEDDGYTELPELLEEII